VDSEALNHHLSRIETHWTAVFQAHQGEAALVAEAQSALMRRYGGAVHRYLLASLRDPEAADDLSQEFALRFLRGDFRNADPGKGRFRDFLKSSIYHLMVDYHRGRLARPRLLGENAALLSVSDADSWGPDLDRQFLDSWREQMMARAWAELDKVQERSGQPFADVLRLRVANPDLRSPQLAERVSAGLGRLVNAGWVRTNLHRAREMFVESLLGEVERSLGNPSPERLEEELSDLGLLEHCRSALYRRGRPPLR
jgi:DNA-directed RNA polymerase specialized sigma24 family protein